MGRQDYFKDEWAVSETVGFIIIFGIVMAGIGLVTLYGYPALLNQQTEANIRNMEKSMIVLQSDMNSLTFKNVPFQETTLQVAGGTFMVSKEPNPLKPYFEVTKGGFQIPGVPKFYPGELKFISEDGDAVIVTENGAIHKRYYSSAGGSVMISEPRWFYDEPTQTFVMSFLRINASRDFAQTGIGTVSMKNVNSEEHIEDVTGSTVRIEYRANPDDNYNIAWKNYFDKSDLKMTYGSGDGFYSKYKLDPSVKRLVIKTYYITVLSL